MPTIACSICWATLGDAQCRQLVASTWRNARWHRGYKATSKTGTTVYFVGHGVRFLYTSGTIGQVLGNSLKSIEINIYPFKFVNVLCKFMSCQLRPYLLLTASSGKPTLCLCSHRQTTLQKKKVPCLPALPSLSRTKREPSPPLVMRTLLSKNVTSLVSHWLSIT